MHSTADKVEKEYSQYLTTATSDAVKDIADSGEKAFGTEEVREDTVDVFYHSLSTSFKVLPSNSHGELSYYIPCIAMIDTDGMYFNYNEDFTDENGDTISDSITTPLYTWSEKYIRFIVRFYLSDMVSVENINTGQTVSGQYYKVYNELNKPTELSFMNNYEEFEEMRNSVIINTTNQKIDYYINAHTNMLRNRNNVTYSMTMPQIANEDWARLLQGPTVISFMQGMQVPNYDKFINIYALCGGELHESETYYVTKEDNIYLYHRVGCSHIKNSDNIITSGSMKDLAKLGAEPCFDCIK